MAKMPDEAGYYQESEYDRSMRQQEEQERATADVPQVNFSAFRLPRYDRTISLYDDGQQYYADQGRFSAAQQAQLAWVLGQAAEGKGPSAAQETLKQGSERNLAAALAMYGSQRGGGTPAMYRAYANQRAAITQQTASDAAVLRAQEQAQARAALAQLLAQMRAQDNDMNKFYGAGALSADQLQLAAQMDRERLLSGERTGAAQREAQLVGAGMQAGGTILNGYMMGSGK